MRHASYRGLSLLVPRFNLYIGAQMREFRGWARDTFGTYANAPKAIRKILDILRGTSSVDYYFQPYSSCNVELTSMLKISQLAVLNKQLTPIFYLAASVPLLNSCSECTLSHDESYLLRGICLLYNGSEVN